MEDEQAVIHNDQGYVNQGRSAPIEIRVPHYRMFSPSGEKYLVNHVTNQGNYVLTVCYHNKIII